MQEQLPQGQEGEVPTLRESRDPVYWIVNLDRRVVEVFSLPMSRAYRSRLIFKEGHSVPVVIDGAQIGHVAVKDILP